MSSSRRLHRGSQQPEDEKRIQGVDAALVSDRPSGLEPAHRGKSLGLGLRPAQLTATHPAFGERPRPLDALLGELLEGVARVLASNPEIAHRLTGLLATDASTSTSLLVTKTEYAERLKYSVRKLDQLVQAGLPTVGKGRSLRIPVATADRWVLENVQSVTEEQAAVDIEAIANAKRRSAQRRK
jgi:hypothetical protein